MRPCLPTPTKKIEELDTRRQTISKAIAELSVETISPQQIKKLSYYLDNWDSIEFLTTKRKSRRWLDLYDQGHQRPCSDRVENLTFPLYRPSFLFYLVCTPCTPMFLAIFNHLLNHCLFCNVQALQFGIINPYPFAYLDSLFNVGAAKPLDFSSCKPVCAGAFFRSKGKSVFRLRDSGFWNFIVLSCPIFLSRFLCSLTFCTCSHTSGDTIGS